MLHRTTAALTLAAPLLAWSAGCTKSPADTTPPEETPAVAVDVDETAPDEPAEAIEPAIPEATEETEPETVAALSDPEIIGIVDFLHQTEIDQGELARAKGRLEPIKEFADKMVEQHGEADRRLDALTANLGFAAATSDLGDRMRADIQSKTDALIAMEAGDAFDREYINTQVELHARALELVDKTLLPAATTDALRDELGQLVVLFRDHLNEAEKIQTDMTGVPQT